ncbi:MAG: hypothetical protein LBT59_22185 [Clostridiales bacterium]|jgi:hypothetical protein|nr:hypothetical protein [Clostridiales bacterium]
MNLENFQEHIPKHILQRGLDLLYHGASCNFNFSDDYLFTSQVDVRTESFASYHVRIALDQDEEINISQSSCTCRSAGVCEHMACVIFKINFIALGAKSRQSMPPIFGFKPRENALKGSLEDCLHGFKDPLSRASEFFSVSHRLKFALSFSVFMRAYVYITKTIHPQDIDKDTGALFIAVLGDVALIRGMPLVAGYYYLITIDMLDAMAINAWSNKDLARKAKPAVIAKMDQVLRQVNAEDGKKLLHAIKGFARQTVYQDTMIALSRFAVPLCKDKASRRKFASMLDVRYIMFENQEMKRLKEHFNR